MDAIRIARALHRPRHDREDLRLLPRPPRLRDGLDRRALRQDRRPRQLASLPYGAGIPKAVVGHDDRRAVQRRRRDGAADRAPDRGGPQARLRDHGGGDDEPRGRAARAGLPRGGPRDHRAPRHRPDLRRGQDRPLHRRRRRDRAVRRRCRTWSRWPRRSAAGSRPARSAAPRRSWTSSRTAASTRSAPTTGTRSRWPRRAPSLSEVLTPDAYAHLDALNDRILAGCEAVLEKYNLPGYTVGIGSKGCVTFSPEKIVDYETFKANQDGELTDLAWLYNMNRGIFMTPGPRGGVDALRHALRRGLRRLRRRLRGDGRRPHRLVGLSSGTSASPCSPGGRGRRGTSPWPDTSRRPAW